MEGGYLWEGVFISERLFGEGVVVMGSDGVCGDIWFDKRLLYLES